MTTNATNALADLRDYLDDHADVRDGSDGPSANEPMRLLSELDEVSALIDAREWRWRFAWFAQVVDTVARLEQIGPVLTRLYNAAYDSHGAGGEARARIEAVEALLFAEVA